MLWRRKAVRQARTNGTHSPHSSARSTADIRRMRAEFPRLIYYFQEFARGATIFMYHNDRCTVGIAAHQAARKGRAACRGLCGSGWEWFRSPGSASPAKKSLSAAFIFGLGCGPCPR